MKKTALALALLFILVGFSFPAAAQETDLEPCISEIVVNGTQVSTVVPPRLAQAIEKRAEMERLHERRYDYNTSQDKVRDLVIRQGVRVN